MKKNILHIFCLLTLVFLSLGVWGQTATYYFNSYNATNTWNSGQANIVDGSTTTFGTDNDVSSYLPLGSNTCPGTNLGTITKVEIRVYFKNNCDAGVNRTIVPGLIPYFNGSTAGATYNPTNGNYDASNGFPNWSSYFDITSDANAPGTWTWADVQNLDCRLITVRPSQGAVDVYCVEIRVTYTVSCTPISSFPWTEGFEGLASVSTTIFPTCWLEGTGTNWRSQNASSSLYNDPRTGSKYVGCVYSGTNDRLWTPGFDLVAGVSYDFSTYFVGDGYSGWTGNVVYNTSQSATGETVLGSAFIASGTTSTSGTNYAQILRTFTPVSSGTYYFGIRITSTTNPWSSMSFDDFSLSITPTCLPPSSLTSSSIATTTATISWAAASPAPASGYTYEIRTNGAAGSGASGLVVSGSTIAGDVNDNISGLTANTPYFVYVRSFCGGSDYSAWTSSYSFTTLKIEPTNQPTNFSHGTVTTSAIPLTWTAAATGAQAPDGYLIKLATGAVANPVDGTDPVDDLGVVGGVANKKVIPGTATSTGTFTGMAVGTMYNYKIYSYTNSGTSINFNLTSPPAINYATKPNVATALSATGTGFSTADISWTLPASYTAGTNSIMVFVKPTSAVTAGTPTNAPTAYTANTTFGLGTAYQNDAAAYCVYKGDGTTVSITGLNPSTVYHVMILSVVDASNWNSTNTYSNTAVANGVTLCDAISSLPWTENFDALTPPSLPLCWAIEDNAAASEDWVTSTSNPSSSPNCMYIGYDGSSALNDWAFSPAFNLTGGVSYTISFKYRAGDDYYSESLELFVGTDQTSAAMSTELFDDASFSHATYQDVLLNYIPASTGVYNFGWHAYSIADQWSINVDDIALYVTPSCPDPTALTATNIIYNQADLSWTETGVAAAWDIEFGPAGFTPTGIPTQSVTDNPYTLTGLTAETTYQYYVRADCGGGVYSTWTGPYSFTTTCQGIGGTVNVGSGQTYTTLTGAGGLFEKINQCGLIGDLIVNITSDITEPGTNDLNQWAGTYTLTIQPSAATVRVISGTISDGLIRLDGADRVTINGNYLGSGQYLRFQNTSSTSPASVFEIVNDAGNLTITNCLIEGGYYGIYYYYNDANTNVISNSSIYDFQYYGLYSYYCDGSISLSQNSIYTTTSKNNTRYAIYLYESESVLVEKNKIYDILPGSSYYAYGIYTSYSNSVIRNNMISLSPANNYYVYGIYYSGSTSYTTDIYFNSIYIGGSGTSACSSYGIYKSSAASTFNFKNNIVYNNRTASTANQYALYFSSSSGINSDHNQLYASNATYGYVGYWVSTACQTLANWQTTSAKDAYSFGILPSFISVNDLHITAGTGLVGLAVAGITDDFDGDSRTSPAIGADEIAIPLCAGTPNAGTATISVASGCSGISFNITTSGLSLAPGISYQWQSSPDGTNGWVDISGATSPTYSSSVSTTTYYRLVSTCSYSSQTNETNVVSFTVTGNDCVCGNYSDNYASYTSYEDIGNVVVGTLTNTSILGDVAGGVGSVAYEYSNYTGIVSAPDLQQLANVSFSVTSIISSGSSNNGFQIYIDYDHDGTFESAERAYSSPTATSGAHTETGSFVIPIDALTGITRMRVVCVRATFPSSSNYAESYYSYGETEDYCVNITPAPECSGTPDAGTATISAANGCADVNFTLSASGLTAATGISYQWQASANGTTGWADISGATSITYIASTSVNKYYRLVTTCSLSSQTNETNVVSYTVSGNACVCESYPESYSNFYTSYEDIGNVTVGTLNNSSTLGELAAGANSESYIYSNYAGVVAAPDLQQLEVVSLSLTSIISSGSYNNGFQIFIDYNQDGVFSNTERVYSSPSAIAGAHTETGSFVVPITALSGITRMRVINIEETFPSSTNYTTSFSYDHGEIEDYCVNITLAPNCDATPNAGTASINFASGCLSTPHTVSATGLTAATGIQFHWQYSLDGSTGWTDIEDADASSYTNITDVTTYYRLESTCSYVGLSNYSNVVSYTVTGADCCVSTLNLYDDGSDGWDGDYVTVTVGSTEIGTYTLASGAGPQTIYITSDADEAISIVYTGTNNYDDSYFDLIGPDGTFYAQDWYPSDYDSWYDGPWNGRGCPIPQPGDMCDMSIAFCTGTNYSFPTGVNNPPAPEGPEYGCLGTQPNPVYYYLRIDQPGSMEILIESDCGDVDFAAWGPFDATTCDPADLTADGATVNYGNYDQPYGNLVDCAYSTAAIEYLSIPDAEVGEYYMVMINNFANCDGIISFEQLSGEGSSDCSIVAPPVSNSGPYCVGQDIELSVNYPVTGATYSWTGPNGFTSSDMNPTIADADPSDSGTYSLIITVGSEVSEPETTDVTVSNPQPLTTVAAGDFVFRNIGTDWNTASNWLECTGADAYSVSSIVPTALDNVVICAGTTCASSEAIIYTVGATCNNITIENGCVLTVDGAHSLTVHSNWTNNGTFNPSTGTVVFNGTSNVLGSTISHDFYNVTINASKIMTAPATNMNVMGNWTNNGTFNHNTGTVTLLGSSAQNVSSGINSQFYNLTVQNSSTGISLLDNAEVLNILTLNDGVVSTSANRIISRSTLPNSIDGFSNQSFINGNLRKFVSNTTTYACPVGLGTNSTDYHRLDFISNISGGTSYLDIWVEAITESANNIDANISTAFQDANIIEVLGEDAIWHIVPDFAPVGTYGVKLYVENMGLSGLDDNMFFVTKRSESSSNYSDWDTFDDIVSIPANSVAGRIFDGGLGFAQALGFNSFSQFSIAKSNTILPVELLNFNITCLDNKAKLAWQTGSEINNDYFIVEKSYDLKNFSEVARIRGVGNSNTLMSYSVNDENVDFNLVYYRLVQVDFDGSRNVSKVITADCFSQFSESPVLIAYPNPFNSQLRLVVENCKDETFAIEIFDNASRLVFSEVFKDSENAQNINLDLNYLNPGIYSIRYKSEKHTIIKKIAKQ